MCVTGEVADPGSFVVVDVAGRSLIVCRNRSGELRCPPQLLPPPGNEPMRDGAREGRALLSVPVHAWAYDLDGVLLGTPFFTPEAGIPADQEDAFDMSGIRGFDKADYGLHPARVDSWGCLVFCCLDPEAPSCATNSATCRAAGRAPPRGAHAAPAGRLLDRGELEARRRELRGVLPPALGAPGARQSVPAEGPLPLAGLRHVHGVLHDSDRCEHGRRGMARASRAFDAERGRPRAHGSPGSSPTSR